MGSVETKYYLEGLGTDVRIILKWNCKKYDVRTLTGSA
jgi:hypothetical protein